MALPLMPQPARAPKRPHHSADVHQDEDSLVLRTVVLVPSLMLSFSVEKRRRWIILDRKMMR